MVIDWRVALLALAVFLLVVALTQYVSLGSICAAPVSYTHLDVYKRQGDGGTADKGFRIHPRPPPRYRLPRQSWDR